MQAIRKACGVCIVLMMTASAAFICGSAGAVPRTSFNGDFESPTGLGGWSTSVGTGNTVELSQAAYASWSHSLHIVKGANSNLARAVSPKVALDYWSNYSLSLRFLLPNVTENAVLLVDDGRIYVTVSTIGDTLLRFYCPTLAANIIVTQGSWHWLTMQVHPVVGSYGFYDVILDGVAVSHNMGFKTSPTMSFATGTDASTSRKVTGQLYLDDIMYNGNPGKYAESFNDGSISDWTVSLGTNSIIQTSGDYCSSPPYSLWVHFVGAKAVATSPPIACDFSSDYNVAFSYFEAMGGSPTIVYNDGRVELRQSSGSLYYKNSAGTYVSMGPLPDIWPPMHKFEISVQPGATPTPNFVLTVDGSLWGTYPLKSTAGSDRITLGTDPSPSKKYSGNAYWDDICVGNGILQTDSDNDGIPDQVEVAQGTDPYAVGKWAVVFSGGGAYYDSTQLPFEWQIDQATMTLHQFGFTDASIRELSLTKSYSDPDNDGINDIDMTSSRANLQSSLAWVAANSDADDVVFILLVDHGDYVGNNGRFQIGSEYVMDYEFASWVAPISSRLMTVVIDCCNSGMWIDDLAGPGRMVFTATNSGGTTMAGWPFSGTYFSEPFFKAIAQGSSLEDSFQYACQMIQENWASRMSQYPVMSDFDSTAQAFVWC